MPDEQQPDEQQPDEQQPDGRQRDGQQPGEQQPGEQQPGEQQPGEQQPGEQQPGEPTGRPADRPADPSPDVLELVAGLPKVLLHDHLDGGLRPATLVELAAAVGHELPTSDPEELARWFVDAASSGSLERYLETFAHTVAVMQTAEGLTRVAREAVLDLAADGVVYAELRYAPEQHLEGGLSLQEVVDAVQAGFAQGVVQASADGHAIRTGTLLTAMRQADRWVEVARLAVDNRGAGVVGFDLAGPEDGFPPSRHPEAFALLERAYLPATVHAGEAAGLDSIGEALVVAHAVRLGHGVRIADDIVADALGDRLGDRLGDLAQWVLDRRVPLEVCPSSNLQTGAAASIAEHPVTQLKQLGFAVTVSTDNRLQSATSLTRELALLVEQAGWTLEDLRDVAVTAAGHAFLHADERATLIDTVIRPAYASAVGGRHRA